MIRATAMTHAFASAASKNKSWVARQVEDRIVHTKVGLVKDTDHVHVKAGTALRITGSIIGALAPKQVHPRVTSDEVQQ